MSATPLALKAMLGTYPGTAAFRSGALATPLATIDFADVAVPNTAFKRTVRALEFDFSELAIVTFLIAKAHGKPLVLLPNVIVGRFQHPYLCYNAERGKLGPDDLNGKRIGVRSYSVTTVSWIRGMLVQDHGLDIDRVQWVTFEEGHVAEFVDPSNCVRASGAKSMEQMLLDGELDAAVIGGTPKDPRIQPVWPDPEAAGRAWGERNRAIQINHMVVVKASLSRERPDVVRELYRLLCDSKKAAGLGKPGTADALPTGVEANRRNLEVAIESVFAQRLIPRRFSVDELFDDVTQAFV